MYDMITAFTITITNPRSSQHCTTVECKECFQTDFLCFTLWLQEVCSDSQWNSGNSAFYAILTWEMQAGRKLGLKMFFPFKEMFHFCKMHLLQWSSPLNFCLHLGSLLEYVVSFHYSWRWIRCWMWFLLWERKSFSSHLLLKCYSSNVPVRPNPAHLSQDTEMLPPPQGCLWCHCCPVSILLPVPCFMPGTGKSLFWDLVRALKIFKVKGSTSALHPSLALLLDSTGCGVLRRHQWLIWKVPHLFPLTCVHMHTCSYT